VADDNTQIKLKICMTKQRKETHIGGVLVFWICSSFSRINSRSLGYSSKRLLKPKISTKVFHTLSINTLVDTL